MICSSFCCRVVLWCLYTLFGQMLSYAAPNSGALSYSYGNIGLATSCDFEWGFCGWTQELAPLDRLDWRRHRGPGGTGWFRISGDHTPGKDGYGFYLYLDSSDFRPPVPVDPDNIDTPDPDELLAQQSGGMASRSIAQPPDAELIPKLPASFHDLQLADSSTLTPLLIADSTAPASNVNPINGSFLHAGNVMSQLGSRGADTFPSLPWELDRQQRLAANQRFVDYRPYPQPPNTDTNSDVKPYDLPNYNYGMTSGTAIYNGHSPGSAMNGGHLNPHQRQFDLQPNAQLVSGRIESPINLTLKFWYHMRGSQVGRLTLYRKVLARPEQIVWEKNGHQSFDWIEAVVSLERGSFQLMFEGTVNPPSQVMPSSGYIGVDDLTLEREADLPALLQNYQKGPTEHIPASRAPSELHAGTSGNNFGSQLQNGPTTTTVTDGKTMLNFTQTGGTEISPPVNRPVIPTMQYPPYRPVQDTTKNPSNTASDHANTTFSPRNLSLPMLTLPDGVSLFPKFSTASLRISLTTTNGSNQSSEHMSTVFTSQAFSGAKAFLQTDGSALRLTPTVTSQDAGKPNETSAEITANISNLLGDFEKDVNYNDTVKKETKTALSWVTEWRAVSSVTNTTSTVEPDDIEFGQLEPTEVSAVRAPAETINVVKLLAVIASCFGLAGLVVFTAVLIKRGSCPKYAFLRCLKWEPRPVNSQTSQALGQSSRNGPTRRASPARPTIRRPAPPPPPPLRLQTS